MPSNFILITWEHTAHCKLSECSTRMACNMPSNFALITWEHTAHCKLSGCSTRMKSTPPQTSSCGNMPSNVTSWLERCVWKGSQQALLSADFCDRQPEWCETRDAKGAYKHGKLERSGWKLCTHCAALNCLSGKTDRCLAGRTTHWWRRSLCYSNGPHKNANNSLISLTSHLISSIP